MASYDQNAEPDYGKTFAELGAEPEQMSDDELEGLPPVGMPTQTWFVNQISALGEDAGTDFNDADDVQGLFGFQVEQDVMILTVTYIQDAEDGNGPTYERKFQLIEIITPSPEVEHDTSLDVPKETLYEAAVRGAFIDDDDDDGGHDPARCDECLSESEDGDDDE